MGLLHNLKSRLAPAKDRMSHFAQQHGDTIDKIEHGIDRAAKAVDERTKGKYSDKIHAGTGKAKGAMDRFAHKGGTEATDDGPGTGPDVPPPVS
ncbi:antitoxin [Streptomyces sp. NPDC046915]|uniref:antitoxin n=1 Tax=Streptomyces sp. NPDC046915 TaxID=3155257 RepID=UPI0033F2366D